jgi:multimeric flavodoxin WrbA
MNSVILHGGREPHAGLDAACDHLADAFTGLGATVRTLRLAEMRIRPCAGCFGCWLRTPGECVHDDDGREVARALVEADVRVFLTPVTFGGYSSLIKTAEERGIPTISPLFRTIAGEMHHRRRYDYPSVLLAVGWQEAADAESAAVFASLVRRNGLNLHALAAESLVLTAALPAAEQRERIAALAARAKGALS